VEEFQLASNDVELVVLPEVGGRLHRVRAYGIDVLRTPNDPAEHVRDPFYWGSYPMLPWGGRVNSGRYEVAGRVVDLPSNHPDGWAIHGQAYVAPWQVVDHSRLRFVGGGNGWPWTYEAEMAFDVGPAVLRIDLALTNTDSAEMPAGIGLHPWFRTPVEIRVPAELAYDDNSTSSPRALPVSGGTDLRAGRELEVGIDTTWTGLSGYQVGLAWPESGLGADMLSESSDNLVIVAARPQDIDDAIALEPQTHAPQGMRRLANGEPDSMTLLQPGETIRLSTTLRFRR